MYVGTENFKSTAHAVKYYESQGYDKDYVMKALKSGAIKTGRPQIKAGEKLALNNEGRYVIIINN